MQGHSHIITCDVGMEFTKVGYCGEEVPAIHVPTEEYADDVSVLARNLSIFGGEALHLIMTENSIDKKDVLETLFEQRIAESLLFIDSSVLDLFSYNRANGVIVSYGGRTSVTSIIDGYVENRMVQEGGASLNEQLVHDLGLRVDQAREFKEEHLEIGSGRVVELGGAGYCTRDINKRAEELFVVESTVKEFIESSENKSILGSNIYMTGAGARTKGLESRMKEELKSFRNKIVHEPKFHTFFGASVLGSIAQARSLFVCTRDYEEHGDRILCRKTLSGDK